MSRAPSATLRGKELAARLRELRTGAGLTIADVAERLLVSPTKISRLETAVRPASLRDVRDLSAIYGVSADERDRLLALARDSRKRSWWQQYDLPYDTYVGLEASAVAILEYRTTIVPALLQTPAYAQAVTEGVLYDSPAETVAQRVEARLIRQRLLDADSPPRLWTVVDEAALHREVGGRAVMAEQLAALADWAARPNVTVQVLSHRAGAHPGMDSSFTLLQLEEGVPNFVYVEGLLGDHYLESSVDLTRYSRVFDHLRASALGPRDSISLITELTTQLSA